MNGLELLGRHAGSGCRATVRDLVVLGLNHEQQHQELFLTDLKYTFSVNPLFPAYREGFAPRKKLTSAFGAVLSRSVGGIYEIGYDGDGFCFDNELARHKVYLEISAIRERLVTNGEFIEFVEAGGYTRFPLLAFRRLGLGQSKRNRIAALLACTRWRMVAFHARRFAGVADRRSRLPCLILRGRSVRRMEGNAAADRIRMGSSEQQIGLGQTLGMDELCVSAVSRISKKPRVPSANTTASL